MKSVKRYFLLILLVLLYGVSAQAGTLLFNDTNLGTLTVGSLDWNVGNALAVDALPLATLPDTNTFNVFYQAALSGFNDINGDDIVGTGLNSAYEITIVAGFKETGSIFGTAASLTVDPTGPINYLEIYYDTATNSNNLNGTGFTDGTSLISATITDGGGGFFITSSNIVNLDQSADGNNFVGVGTIVGTGATSLNAHVDSYDTSLILNSAALSNILLSLNANTSLVTPFGEQNPSLLFQTLTSGNITPDYTADYTGNPNYDYINGLFPLAGGDPKDFHFQADANMSVSTVPEPTTMLLFGFGLLGAAVVGRKKLS